MRSEFYEQELNKQGVQFSYLEELKIEDIDEKKSLQNQARMLEPLDEDLIPQYQASLQGGDKFPPIVVYKPTPRSRCIIIDGNQRKEAYKRNRHKSLDAYLVDCQDPQVVDRITWTFNNKVNGKRLSAEESLEHAVTFVRKYSMTVQDAAREWGVSKSLLQQTLTAKEIRDVMDRNGVEHYPVLTDTRLTKMASLQQAGEDILIDSLKIVGKAGLSEPDTLNLIRNVKRAKTQEEKKQAVQEFASSEIVKNRAAETKGGKILKIRPSTKFQRWAMEGLRLVEGHDKKALLPVGSEYKKVRAAVEDLVYALIPMFGLGVVPGGKEEVS